MTIDHPSLFEGDSSAEWARQLGHILAHTLGVIRTAEIDGAQLSQHELSQALDLVRQIADELRVIGSPDDVPF